MLGKRKRQEKLPPADRSQARIDHYFRGPVKQPPRNQGNRSIQAKLSQDIEMHCSDAVCIHSDSTAQCVQQSTLDHQVPERCEHAQAPDGRGMRAAASKATLDQEAVGVRASCNGSKDLTATGPTEKAVKAGKEIKLMSSQALQMRHTVEQSTPATSGAQQDLSDHLAMFLSALAERQQFRE